MNNKKFIGSPIKLAFASSFVGSIGGAIGSSAIAGAGETMGGFVKPLVNLDMGYFALKKLKSIK